MCFFIVIQIAKTICGFISIVNWDWFITVNLNKYPKTFLLLQLKQTLTKIKQIKRQQIFI